MTTGMTSGNGMNPPCFYLYPNGAGLKVQSKQYGFTNRYKLRKVTSELYFPEVESGRRIKPEP